MKLRQPNPKKKLRATAARRAPQSRSMDEEEEPTIRLSSAFVVVLLLHFVAIGGIWSFESIKVTQREGGDILSAKQEAEAAKQATAAAVAATEPKVAPGEVLTAATAARTTTATPVSAPASQPRKTSAPAPAAVKESGTVHVVESGENPVGIARKYGVNYEELLKLNKIDDPRRLQIGQKLQIPAKAK